MAEDVANNQDQPYQALYRRYRPQLFAQVRGQEHVTRALRNAVRDDRVAHAFLFSGPRGTGKTSTARILAMALNCASPQDGEPDGTCTSCQSIRAGASMDVFELDAASNRKLDEMRDLLSRVALGTPGRWKVYIIDEVHQLTPDAASALLKTLEEPPGHVVFVLATTDPQKVLPTIQSRAQHFEFRLLDGDELTSLLSQINEDAALGLSAQAVQTAVLKARGSARDAESALEQLAAAGGDETATNHVPDIVAALARRDAGEVLQSVAVAIAAGKEPRRLGNDLVEHLRNAFLALQAPSLLLLPGPATAQLAGTGQQMGLAFLVRCMETIGQALVDMRDSVDTRVTLEVALVRLAAPATDTSPAAIVDRLERLERAVAQGVGSASGPSGTAPVPVPTSLPTSLPSVATSPSPTSSSPMSPSPTSSRMSPGQSASAAAPAVAAEGRAAQARATLGAILRGGGAASSRPTDGGAAGSATLGPGPNNPAPNTPGPSAAAAGTSETAAASPRPPSPAPTTAGTNTEPKSETTPPATAHPTDAPSAVASRETAVSPVAPSAPAPPAATASASTTSAAVPTPSAAAPPAAASSAAEPTTRPTSTPAMAAQPVQDRGAPSPAASPAGAQPVVTPPTAPQVSPSSLAPPAAPGAGTQTLPSRDELTKAWGDTVLDKLPRPAKIYMANGRFSEVTPAGAVFALPDAGLLNRATNFQADAEKALASHFGLRVPLRLVLDRSAPPPATTGREAPEGPEEEYDLSDFREAADAPAVPDVSPEQRILQAFPGAVIDN